MKKRNKAFMAAFSTAMLAAVCSLGAATAMASQESYEVTDLVGRTVSIPADTDSYACIGPGALRLYCYVADKGELAGLEEAETSWGNAGKPYTKALGNTEEYPVIGVGGAGVAPDAEMLLAASPDVIFTCYTQDMASIDKLQDKTGIPVVALNYGGNLGEARLFAQETYDSLELIGKITGNEDRAKEVVDYFEAAKEDIRERTADIEEKAEVYLGCMSNKGSHGIESTTGDYSLFDELNAANVAKEAGITEYAMIDKEMLLVMDPEIMIIDAAGLSILQEDYRANPEFYDALSAVKNGKLYLQMPFNFYTTNLEIALADAYYLGTVLYPEKFADIDPAAKFDEITRELLGIEVYDEIAEENYGGYQQVTLEK